MEREFINKKIGIIVSFGIGDNDSSLILNYEGILMDANEDYIKVDISSVETYPIITMKSSMIKIPQEMGITIIKKKNVIMMYES